jgi:hypothetical protein
MPTSGHAARGGLVLMSLITSVAFCCSASNVITVSDLGHHVWMCGGSVGLYTVVLGVWGCGGVVKGFAWGADTVGKAWMLWRFTMAGLQPCIMAR